MYAIIAAIIVSLISFVGVFTIFIKDKIINKVLLLLVGFSAGALMGGAFIHLIPEVLEGDFGDIAFIWIIAGFSLFFILERIIHWHHCHKHGGDCEVHTFTYMNLVGDGFHNFIDGLILAAAFSVDINVGIATSVAVISHEIPQEISDFGVLLYGGFSKAKALFYNFLSAILAVIGAVVGLVLINYITDITPYLIAISAGGFIYISASDLIPELHREPKINKSLLSFLFFIFGVVFMYVIKMMFE